MHKHKDGTFDGYWIPCTGCGARRAPGGDWQVDEVELEQVDQHDVGGTVSDPRDAPLPIQILGYSVLASLAMVIISACVWLVAVILRAVTLL